MAKKGDKFQVQHITFHVKGIKKVSILQRKREKQQKKKKKKKKKKKTRDRESSWFNA
jgi:hypothetical protein